MIPPSAVSPDPVSEYQRRRALRQTEVAHSERRDNLIAQLRGVVFVAGVVVVVLAFRGTLTQGWSAPSIAAPLLLFVALVLLHNRAERALQQARLGVAFYADGLERLDGRWAGRGMTGNELVGSSTLGDGPVHPYARDLDLFGRASLFELLCRARTRLGQRQLAEWLKTPVSVEEARARQEAVEELRPRVELREEMARLGQELNERTQLAVTGLAASGPAAVDAELSAWASAPARFTAPLVWSLGMVVSSLAVIVSGAAWWYGRWPPLPVIGALCIELGIYRLARPHLAAVEKPLAAALDDLEALSVLLSVIENQPMQSPWLVALRKRAEGADGTASHAVASLRRRTELLLQQRNQFFAPIGFVIGWPIHCAIAVELWRLRHGARLAGWLGAAAELEALLSLSSFAYEHPDYARPRFCAEPRIEARGLAHPLLGAEAVGNDVALGAPAPQLLLVSGSNMSGKSTLLRALGTNLILAQLGAPVRASDFVLGPLQLGASIQVEDSLAAGASRFYAEILRLKQVADLAPGPASVSAPTLLFLLDEILAGTNSHDRQIGAAALLRALVAKGAIGLCTTHDLVLTRVVDELGSRAANVHFADHVEGQRLVFDYRMRPGVVERSNALELMRSIGLDV